MNRLPLKPELTGCHCLGWLIVDICGDCLLKLRLLVHPLTVTLAVTTYKQNVTSVTKVFHDIDALRLGGRAATNNAPIARVPIRVTADPEKPDYA